jgi:hypothetical protein
MTDYHGGLAKKLAEVSATLGWIEKRGTAPKEIGGYQYAYAGDVYATVRKELSSRNVASTVGIDSVRHEPKGDSGNILTTVQGDLSFIDGDTGEVISVPIAGVGMDKGDKGIYKAITGGVRDALKANFLLPTGDDPEATAPEAEDKPRSQPRPVTTTGPKPPAAEKPVLITDSQRKLLMVKLRERGIESDGQRQAFVMFTTGKHSSKQMTSADFDNALSELADLDSQAVSNALAVV